MHVLAGRIFQATVHALMLLVVVATLQALKEREPARNCPGATSLCVSWLGMPRVYILALGRS